MTEEEMVAEAIRRGEETADAEIAADAQRAAQERDRLQNELDSVSDQIEAAKQQAAEANNRFLRLQADWDNYRRRTAQERLDERRPHGRMERPQVRRDRIRQAHHAACV